MAPNACDASTESAVTPADAERGDAHGRRDRVDHRADHGGRGADREQDHHRHQVGEGGHDLHRVERRRDRCGGSARCVRRSTPTGMPIASESSTAADISASVCMLSSHRPMRANETKAPSTISAARQPPKRSTISTRRRDRAHPGEPRAAVVERGHEPLRERPEAVEEREDGVRALGGALVEQPALERRRACAGQLLPGERRRPGELVAPAARSRAASARRSRPPAPPRPRQRDGGRRERRRGEPAASYRHRRAPGPRARPPSPGGSLTRSTMPTHAAVLDRAHGPSVAATTGTASWHRGAHRQLGALRLLARLAGRA